MGCSLQFDLSSIFLYVSVEILKSLCRMKERAKRAGAQMKEEESERSALQVIITQSVLRPSAPSLLSFFSNSGDFCSV